MLYRRPSRFEEWVFQRGIRSRQFRLCYYALAPVPLAVITPLLRVLQMPKPIQLFPLAGMATIWTLGAAIEVKVLIRGWHAG